MSLFQRGTFIIFIANAKTNVTYRKLVDWTVLIFSTDQGINHIFPAVFTVL